MSEGYIAGRDLYDGPKVRFAKGETVPTNAFPRPAIESLLGNGGLRRFRAEHTDRKLINTVPPGDHPVAAEPEQIESQPSALAEDLHQLNTKEAAAVIAALDSADALESAEAHERINPKYVGGRTSVLQAIEAQRQRLLEPGDG